MSVGVSDREVDWHEELTGHFDGVEQCHVDRAQSLVGELDVHAVCIQLYCESILEARVNALSDELFAKLLRTTSVDCYQKDRSWPTMLLVQRNYEVALRWLNELPQ